MTLPERFRLAILGAGPAGLAAADFAARLGVSVVLIERHRVGGDCTWTGCVPSKALLHMAELVHAGPETHGTPDFSAAMHFVREAIERVYRFETPEALASRGVTVLHGEARFIDPHMIQVEDRHITADRIMIATGARPDIPAVAGLQQVPYLTYESIFDLVELPRRLIVLGAGPVGVELAQAFARLGSRVTLLERRAQVVSIADPEASDILQAALERDGVAVRLGAQVNRASMSSTSGETEVLCGSEALNADAVLVAAGRRPAIEALALDAAGVVWSPAGIEVDDWLRTSQRHIYACGDAIGSFQFTHYAGWQAVIAARNALLPGRTRGRLGTVPWTLFTDPKIAQVGLNEGQARERYGTSMRVVRWPIERVDRAVTEGDTEGLLKLMHLPNGRLVGATIVCRRADELADELSLAFSKRLTLADLASAIHVYPTYGFGIQQAAADAYFEQLVQGRRGMIIRLLARGLRPPRFSR